MPLFNRDITPPSLDSGLSPAKSELEAMIRHCLEIDEPMSEIEQDGDEFGLITEETYCYHAPKLIAALKSITMYARDCARDLAVNEDEMDFHSDPVETQRTLSRFVVEHRRILNALVAQYPTLRTTGPLYDSISMNLQRQQLALQGFRTALETRYPLVRLSSARRFNEMVATLQMATTTYVRSV